jgi:cation transport regulator ChaC
MFGYGSLMNPKSLLGTAPFATDIKPCVIKGYERGFTVWDQEGYSKKWILDNPELFAGNLELADLPFCALNLYPSSKPDALVTGITFRVGEDGYKELLKREPEYEVDQTTAYEFSPELGKIGLCHLFASDTVTGSFAFNPPNSLPQKKYLEIFLNAARVHDEILRNDNPGHKDEFLQATLETTFIGDKSLRKFPKLLSGIGYIA